MLPTTLKILQRHPHPNEKRRLQRNIRQLVKLKVCSGLQQDIELRIVQGTRSLREKEGLRRVNAGLATLRKIPTKLQNM